MSDPLNTPDAPAPKPRKPGRRLRLALIASLAVNLLVIGVLAGGAWRAKQFEPGPPGQPDIRALWHALPREARSELRERSRDMGPMGERPSREERRERAAAMNASLLAALRSEPFDPAQFAALMQGDRDALQRRIDAANAAFAAQLAALTPAQRSDMADELEERWDD